MSKGNSNAVIEKDCTHLCQSVIHGSIITSSITKRDVTDRQLASYFTILCSNFAKVRDEVGRTALHMAASCGRIELCYWLLKNGSDIHARDYESLSTPLHRSIMYGYIHVAAMLTKAGANIFLTDIDRISCIGYAMTDLPLESKNMYPCEVYVWGSNDNYTHGTGNEQSRELPEVIESFRKKNIYIKQVCMDKFHSVFISGDGCGWACGHGTGGRLGVDSETTILSPQPMRTKGVSIKEASIGRDHTLLLMEDGTVMSCGLNTHHQLGHVPPPKQLLTPRALLIGRITKKEIVGVAAARFHSVVWSEDSVYTFGLNAGQLGKIESQESTVIEPRSALFLRPGTSNNNLVNKVATSDGAVVVSCCNGDVYLFHQYQIKKIARGLKDVKKILVSGGHLNSKAESKILMDQGGEELIIVILTSTGEIIVWLESVPYFSKCMFNLHYIDIKDISITYQHLLFATKDGEGYRAEIVAKSKKKLASLIGTSKTPSSDYLYFNLYRIPHLHRTATVVSDPKGRNFAALQHAPKSGLTEVPFVSCSVMKENLESLLEEASDQDPLHDIVFEVGYERFASHRYLLRLSSDLDSLVPSNTSSTEDSVPVVKIVDVKPVIFQQLLKFIYCGDCDLIHPGPVSRRFSGADIGDPIQQCLAAAETYGIHGLVNKLTFFRFKNSTIFLKGPVVYSCNKPPLLIHDAHDDLYDIQIVSSDGKAIKVHKCVLAARVEYFHSMLVGCWLETGATSLKLHVPFTILKEIITYIYTDSDATFDSTDDFDHICSILIAADQMFINRLKQFCEVALTNFLNLRNVCHLMQFSTMYNANQLKLCCKKFITINLPALLEMRVLETLPPDILKDVSEYYRHMIRIDDKRVITPFESAPSDAEIISAYEFSPVAWEDLDDEDKICLNNTITPAKNQGKNSSFSSQSSASGKKKKSHRSTNEVQRKRYESVSSNSDLDVTVASVSFDDVHEEPSDAWITVDKSQKSVQTRLKVLLKAPTIEASPDDYIQLPIPSSSVSQAININNKSSSVAGCLTPPPSLDNTTLFPELSNHFSSKLSLSSSPKSNSSSFTEMKKNATVKLSQKQRKKIAAENLSSKEPSNAVHPAAVSVSPWAIIPPLSTESELTLTDILNDTKRKFSSSKNGQDVPKTAWKVATVPCFSAIVADEIKQRDNLSRMRTKSFNLTQIEDKAIEDLLSFYNASKVSDERITVQRVPYGNIAKPTWITTRR